MWYISFHGGSGGVNNIQVYHDSGKPHKHPDILPTGGANPVLSELRAFTFRNGQLYVVNAYKKYSQVLVYNQVGENTFTFDATYASPESTAGLLHPYDITFDDQGNGYVSSQDTNLVTGFSNAMEVAPISGALKAKYGDQLYAGTQVASSVGQLPNTAAPYPTDVMKPTGLDVSYTDDTDTRVKHSVRGVLSYGNMLFVADEPGDAVKVYENGKLMYMIAGENLQAPVQLLENNGILYIGSTGNDSVLVCDISGEFTEPIIVPETFIDGKVKHISGMAFDDDGLFYAAERKAKKIKQFDGAGKELNKDFITDLPDNPEFILFVPKPD